MFITLLNDYTFQIVALGSALLGMVSGILGSYAVLRKQSLLGDGVSHSALPGVVMAFLLTGGKNTEILLFGALCTGLLATAVIISIVKHSSIHFDSALAMTMSVFFGFGLVLLTYTQKVQGANQAGLNRFIYGQASTLLRRDLILMGACGTALVILVILFWKEFKLFSFDPEYGKTIGFHPGRINLLLSVLIVLAIIIGLQTVGVVLMSAMLIAPATAARQWSDRLWVMVTLAAGFGALSGVIGTLISSSIPGLPTGPIIVVCITLIAAGSLLFAPGRGILYCICLRKKNRTRFKLEGRIYK